MFEIIKNLFKKKDSEAPTTGYIQIDAGTIILRASSVEGAGHKETAQAAYKLSNYLARPDESKSFLSFFKKDNKFTRTIGIRADHWLVNDKIYQKMIGIKATSKPSVK